MTIRQRRRNQESTVGKPGIQQSKRHWIDRGLGRRCRRRPRTAGCQERLLRSVVSQTGRDQDVGSETVGRRAVVLPCALVRYEEEESIRFDWPTEQSTKYIPLQCWPGNACSFQKQIIGIERVVAEIFITRAMKTVAAAFRNCLDIAAAAAAITRPVE